MIVIEKYQLVRSFIFCITMNRGSEKIEVETWTLNLKKTTDNVICILEVWGHSKLIIAIAIFMVLNNSQWQLY